MDQNQEVKHRWRIANERQSTDHISKQEILADGRFMQKRIEELERDLADALNPVSSRMGSLTHIENGVLFYRINGMFIPLSAVVAGLKLLNDLRKDGALSDEQLEQEADALKFMEKAFTDPFELKPPESEDELG